MLVMMAVVMIVKGKRFCRLFVFLLISSASTFGLLLLATKGGTCQCVGLAVHKFKLKADVVSTPGSFKRTPDFFFEGMLKNTCINI